MTPHIKHYVALGDSLSEGVSDWGRGDRRIGFAYLLADLLRVHNPDLRFTNLGVGGARTADVLNFQLPRLIELQPDFVTLVVGANDVPGTPADEFQRSYADLIQQLRTHVAGTLAITTIPDFAHLLTNQFVSMRAALQFRVRDFNAVIRDQAKKHNALLVDLQDHPEVQEPRNISSDGVHPNARGYRSMARAFAETFNAAGFDLALPTIDP